MRPRETRVSKDSSFLIYKMLKGGSMSVTLTLLKWMVCLALLAIATPRAFAPIFMQYDGIDGDVTATGYERWIAIDSKQWGVGRGISSPTGGTGREASAPNISEIVVTKLQDKSSPHLFAEATVGKAKPVQIHMLGTFGNQLQPYLKITLDKVLISGYSQSSGGDRPSESLSLNFTKITMTYTSYDDNGNQTGSKTVSYDLATGVGTGP
jgi:type VI secretion system secreted protein Hcp